MEPAGYKETPEGQADLTEAERMLDAVLHGKSLRDLSENHRHWPGGHDEERARNTVVELTRLQLIKT